MCTLAPATASTHALLAAVDCGSLYSAGTTWATFSNEQKSNACTVVGVGKGAAGVPEYGRVVAIAAALVESRVLALNCGDRDSVGIFQQRTEVGWCDDIADCINPVTASFAFYGVASHTNNRGLTDISGWESMSVSNAAQAVQVSCCPERYGQQESAAREIVTQCADTPAIYSGAFASYALVAASAAHALKLCTIALTAVQGIFMSDAPQQIRVSTDLRMDAETAGVASVPGGGPTPAPSPTPTPPPPGAPSHAGPCRPLYPPLPYTALFVLRCKPCLHCRLRCKPSVAIQQHRNRLPSRV